MRNKVIVREAFSFSHAITDTIVHLNFIKPLLLCMAYIAFQRILSFILAKGLNCSSNICSDVASLTFVARAPWQLRIFTCEN